MFKHLVKQNKYAKIRLTLELFVIRLYKINNIYLHKIISIFVISQLKEINLDESYLLYLPSKIEYIKNILIDKNEILRIIQNSIKSKIDLKTMMKRVVKSLHKYYLKLMKIKVHTIRTIIQAQIFDFLTILKPSVINNINVKMFFKFKNDEIITTFT